MYLKELSDFRFRLPVYENNLKDKIWLQNYFEVHKDFFEEFLTFFSDEKYFNLKVPAHSPNENPEVYYREKISLLLEQENPEKNLIVYYFDSSPQTEREEFELQDYFTNIIKIVENLNKEKSFKFYIVSTKIPLKNKSRLSNLDRLFLNERFFVSSLVDFLSEKDPNFQESLERALMKCPFTMINKQIVIQNDYSSREDKLLEVKEFIFGKAKNQRRGSGVKVLFDLFSQDGIVDYEIFEAIRLASELSKNKTLEREIVAEVHNLLKVKRAKRLLEEALIPDEISNNLIKESLKMKPVFVSSREAREWLYKSGAKNKTECDSIMYRLMKANLVSEEKDEKTWIRLRLK